MNISPQQHRCCPGGGGGRTDGGGGRTGGGGGRTDGPIWANFTLMMKCTPESSVCYSVYSVVLWIQMFQECSTLAKFSLGPVIRSVVCYCSYNDKKENQIFLICEEIQNGAVAKSYMTNGLLIYGEIFAHFLICSSSYMTATL